jgi:hypothetical protein
MVTTRQGKYDLPEGEHIQARWRTTPRRATPSRRQEGSPRTLASSRPPEKATAFVKSGHAGEQTVRSRKGDNVSSRRYKANVGVISEDTQPEPWDQVQTPKTTRVRRQRQHAASVVEPIGDDGELALSSTPVQHESGPITRSQARKTARSAEAAEHQTPRSTVSTTAFQRLEQELPRSGVSPDAPKSALRRPSGRRTRSTPGTRRSAYVDTESEAFSNHTEQQHRRSSPASTFTSQTGISASERSASARRDRNMPKLASEEAPRATKKNQMERESAKVRKQSHGQRPSDIAATRSVRKRGRRAPTSVRTEDAVVKRAPKTSATVNLTRKREVQATVDIGDRRDPRERSSRFSSMRPRASVGFLGRLRLSWSALWRLWQSVPTPSESQEREDSNTSFGEGHRRAHTAETSSVSVEENPKQSARSIQNAASLEYGPSPHKERRTASAGPQYAGQSSEGSAPQAIEALHSLPIAKETASIPSVHSPSRSAGDRTSAARDQSDVAVASTALLLSQPEAISRSVQQRQTASEAMDVDTKTPRPRTNEAHMGSVSNRWDQRCMDALSGTPDANASEIVSLNRSPTDEQEEYRMQDANVPRGPRRKVEQVRTNTNGDEQPTAGRQAIPVTTFDVIRTFRQRTDTHAGDHLSPAPNSMSFERLSNPNLTLQGHGLFRGSLLSAGTQPVRTFAGVSNEQAEHDGLRFPGSAFYERTGFTPSRPSLLDRAARLGWNEFQRGSRGLQWATLMTPVSGSAFSQRGQGNQAVRAGAVAIGTRPQVSERPVRDIDRIIAPDLATSSSDGRDGINSPSFRVAARKVELPQVPIGSFPKFESPQRPVTSWTLPTVTFSSRAVSRTAACSGSKSLASSPRSVGERRTARTISSETEALSSGTLKRRRLSTSTAEFVPLSRTPPDGVPSRALVAADASQRIVRTPASRLRALIQSLKRSPNRSDDHITMCSRPSGAQLEASSTSAQSQVPRETQQGVPVNRCLSGHDLGLDHSVELDAALDRAAETVAVRAKRLAAQSARQREAIDQATQLASVNRSEVSSLDHDATSVDSIEVSRATGSHNGGSKIVCQEPKHSPQSWLKSVNIAPPIGKSFSEDLRTGSGKAAPPGTDAGIGQCASTWAPERSAGHKSTIDKLGSECRPGMIVVPSDEEDDDAENVGDRERKNSSVAPGSPPHLAVTLPRIPEPWRPPSPPTKARFHRAATGNMVRKASLEAGSTPVLTTAATPMPATAGVAAATQAPIETPHTEPKQPPPTKTETGAESNTNAAAPSLGEEAAATNVSQHAPTLVNADTLVPMTSSMDQHASDETAAREKMQSAEALPGPPMASTGNQLPTSAPEGRMDAPDQETHPPKPSTDDAAPCINAFQGQAMVEGSTAPGAGPVANAPAMEPAVSQTPALPSSASIETRPALPAPARTFHFTAPVKEPIPGDDGTQHALGSPPTWSFLSSPANTSGAPFWFGSSTAAGNAAAAPNPSGNMNGFSSAAPTPPTWPRLDTLSNVTGVSPASLPWPSIPLSGTMASSEHQSTIPSSIASGMMPAPDHDRQQPQGLPAPRRMLKARRSRLP